MTSKILALTAAGALSVGGVALAQSDPGKDPPTPTPVGSIASYSAGKLTITLADGSSVVGKVTRRTHIHCRSVPAAAHTSTTTAPAPPTPPAQRPSDPAGNGPKADGPKADGPAHGPQGSDGPMGHNGPGPKGGPHGPPNGPGRDEDGDDDKPACDTGSLTAGTKVLHAELSATAAGLAFRDVTLQDAS